MNKVSVIIPVYNVEKYIEKCLETVIQQTYKNIEILIVDDGSMDNSINICSKYAKNDDRIKILTKENGGLSSARNYGLDNSTGDYILFIDSDDFISLNMVEDMLNAMIYEKADMVMCSVINCYNDIPIIKVVVEKKVYNREDALIEMLKGEKCGVWAVNKLYKKELFKNARFKVGFTFEDSFIFMEILRECHKIVYINTCQYFYIHRKDSITTRAFDKRCYDVILAWEENNKIIEEEFPNAIELGKMRNIWSYFLVLDRMLMSDNINKTEMKKLVKHIRGNYSFILKNKHLTAHRKIATSILMISTGLYKRVVILQNSKKNKLYD